MTRQSLAVLALLALPAAPAIAGPFTPPPDPAATLYQPFLDPSRHITAVDLTLTGHGPCGLASVTVLADASGKPGATDARIGSASLKTCFAIARQKIDFAGLVLTLPSQDGDLVYWLAVTFRPFDPGESLSVTINTGRVPEPAGLALLPIGLAALTLIRGRKPRP